MNIQTLTPGPEWTGERIDRYVSETLGLARAQVQRWLEDELVTIEGAPRPKNYRLRAGDIVTVAPPEARPYEAVAQDIPLTVAYEDDDLLVVDKPKGMVVHPAAGNYTGTLERESYRLRLVLELCVKEKREFLQKHLRKIIPANLVLQVNLNVNTHGKLHRMRHGEMKEKGLTYGGIPFEILPEEEGNSAVSGEKLLQRMRRCATIQK